MKPNKSNPYTRIQIYRGSYDERGGNRFRTVLKRVLLVALAAIIITLFVDMFTGTVLFDS